MKDVGVKLEINPLFIEKLNSGREKLWTAAHPDGSDNRINSDAVLEASAYGLDFGLIAAGAQWIKKKFRNRGKTKDDFAAEKEAAKINRACGALEIMLLEYFQAAQKGSIDEEGLDELIETLIEMQGYYQSGKLAVPGESVNVSHSHFHLGSSLVMGNLRIDEFLERVNDILARIGTAHLLSEHNGSGRRAFLVEFLDFLVPVALVCRHWCNKTLGLEVARQVINLCLQFL